MSPSSTRRRAVPRDQRLRDVVREASRLFHEKGYEKTTVDELADAMGISVGGLYRYVSTKSDALVMVCDDIYIGLPEELREVAESHSEPLEALGAVIHRYFESCVEHRRLILLMYREFRHLPEDAQLRSQQKEDAIVQVLAAAIRRAQRAKQLRPGEPRLLATDMVLIGHLPALKGWQLHGTRASGAAFPGQQTRLILDALRRE